MNKAETLALFAQGMQAWNAWAGRMLAERKALEEKGEWSEYGEEWQARDDATHVWYLAARADFRDHRFTEVDDLSGMVFPGDADFSGATFSEDAWFYRATFSERARFDDATFSKRAEFHSATFSGNALFRVTFSWDASFANATFSGNAYFRATFSKSARFDLARLGGYTTFEDSRFEKETASFVAIKGESFFSLRGVTFEEVPDFEQAHFAEAPMLDGSVFPKKVRPGESVRWRALKRLAVQGHDHEREQLFFAQEIKSLRGDTDWPLPRLQDWKIVWRHSARYWFGLFYQGFSDFGRSMVLPVVWWVGFTALFAIFYLDQHFPYKAQPYAPGFMYWNARGYPPPLECVKGEASGPLSSAIFLAIHKGSVAGLGGADKLAQSYACLYGEERRDTGSGQPLIPDAVAFMGMGQSLLSAPLIFLFLLAVRNHFRIK